MAAKNERLTADFSGLVEQARAGDQAAYTALYEATSQELYRSIRSMVRSEELALDIQQDSYVFAFSHLDQLGDAAKFPRWLRRIAVNRTRSVLRKQTPVLFTELETDEGSSLPELADLSPEGSPELSLERKETARLVREIMDELSVGQRMLVGMYYYEQMPVEKIAQDLGVKPGTVKTQLFRSRKKIEAAVKRLEAQGVRLYGLSPLPFLLALLKKTAPAEESGKAVLAGSLTKSGVAAEAAAVHVGRSFFQTALGRVALGVLAAAALGGGVMGYRWLRQEFKMGDHQPPTSVESEENLRYDSDEDLTTEPSTVELTTEPVTNVPVTTEPTETEPKTTEPETTAPTESEPSNPANPKPNQPADPTPTNPAAPTPTDPGTSAPTDSNLTDPTESNSAAGTQSSTLTGWTTEMPSMQTGVIEFNGGNPGSCDYLFLSVQGDEVPSLYSDNEAVAVVQDGYESVKMQDGSWTHCWLMIYKGYGSANIYCRLNGVSKKIAVVNNPEQPPTLVRAEWFWLGSDVQSATIRMGEAARFIAEFSYCLEAELVADQPSKVSIKRVDSGLSGPWYQTYFAWMVTPNSAGTIRLYLKSGDKLFGTYELVVLDNHETQPTESTEPTEPMEPTPEPTEPPTEPPTDPTEPEPDQEPSEPAEP